jgi:DNA-directed RNA polymerase alpha subunit
MRSEPGERQDHQRSHQYLDLDIEEMEFSVRTNGLLKDTDIQIMRALVNFSEQDLIHTGFTPRMIREIKDTLGAVGLQLGMRFEESQKDQEEDSQS